MDNGLGGYPSTQPPLLSSTVSKDHFSRPLPLPETLDGLFLSYPDLANHVTSFLDSKSAVRLSVTSKRLGELFKRPSFDWLWNKIVLLHTPLGATAKGFANDKLATDFASNAKIMAMNRETFKALLDFFIEIQNNPMADMQLLVNFGLMEKKEFDTVEMGFWRSPALIMALTVDKNLRATWLDYNRLNAPPLSVFREVQSILNQLDSWTFFPFLKGALHPLYIEWQSYGWRPQNEKFWSKLLDVEVGNLYKLRSLSKDIVRFYLNDELGICPCPKDPHVHLDKAGNIKAGKYLLRNILTSGFFCGGEEFLALYAYHLTLLQKKSLQNQRPKREFCAIA